MSAADKATARSLATEGIQLFQGGEYSQALERLSRAEKLFSAPIHSLYIARCQEKLGKWVEAAETYRALIRIELDADAPQVFKDAIVSGHEELAALEPKLPKLTVDVQPAEVEGLTLTINGEAVSSAAVGVERPTNPGSVLVEAGAPGFEPASLEIELGEAESSNVTLELTPQGNESPSAVNQNRTGTDPAQLSTVGIFVGLGFGAAIPSGNAAPNEPIQDYFKAGGGMQVYGGMRFGRHLGGKIFFQGYAMGVGNEVQEASDAVAAGAGISFIAGDLEPERVGGYAELGLSRHFFTMEGDVLGCRVEDTLSGNAVRLGGTAIIRVSNLLRLTPYLAVEMGSFSSREQSFGSGCPQQATIQESIDPTSAHRLILLGIGGDLMFGL